MSLHSACSVSDAEAVAPLCSCFELARPVNRSLRSEDSHNERARNSLKAKRKKSTLDGEGTHTPLGGGGDQWWPVSTASDASVQHTSFMRACAIVLAAAGKPQS